MEIIKLEPADVLVVHTPATVSRDQRDVMIEQVRAAVGEHRQVLVVDAGHRIDVLRKPRPVSELTVKLDAAEGLAAMRAAMAPGAVLLSAEALAKLYSALDEVRSPEGFDALLRECGAEFSTAKAEPANSQGAGGPQVQHGEPEEVGEVVMPTAVWVRHADLTAQQVLLASDTRPASGASTEHLVQVDFLDAMQRAKYNV